MIDVSKHSRRAVAMIRGARRRLLALLLAAALIPVPAMASDQEDGGSRDDPAERAEELARESIEKMMRALEQVLQAIPQYEMPEITEDGDIIIRRKHPEEEGPEDGEPERAPETPEGDPDTTET